MDFIFFQWSFIQTRSSKGVRKDLFLVWKIPYFKVTSSQFQNHDLQSQWCCCYRPVEYCLKGLVVSLHHNGFPEKVLSEFLCTENMIPCIFFSMGDQLISESRRLGDAYAIGLPSCKKTTPTTLLLALHCIAIPF